MILLAFLVGGIPTPLKNMKVGKDDIPYIMEKKKHVPNHQPDFAIDWTRSPGNRGAERRRHVCATTALVRVRRLIVATLETPWRSQ
jgi:hypothetical protein